MSFVPEPSSSKLTESSFPAECLSGLTLEGGFVVRERLTPAGGTGGTFSVRYRVIKPDGDEAFLKALNLKALFGTPTTDVIAAMKQLGLIFDHEREMLRKCEGMSRVVTAIAEGQANVPGMQFGVVPYFIFEMATGDVRLRLNELGAKADAAWKLRTLHHISVGLQQMHGVLIAHQDLKPSNVLSFPDGSKIGDLGRVSAMGIACPFDDLPSAGDWTYAPPELQYGFISPDWRIRRFGHDLYLLGNMVVFLFSSLSMNGLLFKHLDQQFRLPFWTQGYEAVLPYLQVAFSAAIDEFRAQVADTKLADQLRFVVRQLCNPDINLRGNPQSSRAARPSYAMEQWVSKFNLLARRAELASRYF